MKKIKKNTTTSNDKKGRPIGSGSGKSIPGSDIKIKGFMHGEDPKLIVHPLGNGDFEELAPEPVDELSNHRYPPPKRHPKFRRIWGQFIDGIINRDNFNVGYLNSLEILCDLFVEYEELSAFIRKTGRSYQTFGRSGMIWKLYPEVGQLKSVQHQINVYMKQLGLILKKDESGLMGQQGEWE